MNEKHSTLHTDMYRPKIGGGEYSINENGERVFGKKEAQQVSDRIEQFGITVGAVEEKYKKQIKELSWEEYNEIMAELASMHYDTVVSSAFDNALYKKGGWGKNEKRMKDFISITEQYGEMGKGTNINLIRHKGDFKESGNLIIGLEGGTHLIRSIDDVKKMEEAGVKIFGLQYGGDEKENIIANKDGLSDFGKKVVKHLLSRNKIIDLAHSGIITRKDAMDIAEDQGSGHLITYTHGATSEDIPDNWKSRLGERAIEKEEVERIIKMGGIIGLGVSQPFFENTKKIAERMAQIAELGEGKGINQIAIGSDFGGLPPGLIHEITGPQDMYKIADALSENFKLPDKQIEKIMRKNVKEWIKKAID